MRIIGIALGVALLCLGGAVHQMDEDTYYVSGPSGPTARSDLAAAAARECADARVVAYREADGTGGMTFRCGGTTSQPTQLAQTERALR